MQTSMRIDCRSLSVLVLLFVACSRGEKHTPNPYANDIPAGPATHIVEIKQMKFIPAEIKVRAGDKVMWVNHDIVTHDVTEEAYKAWSSSVISPGSSWSMIATRSADYYCSIHVVMKGKVIVD